LTGPEVVKREDTAGGATLVIEITKTVDMIDITFGEEKTQEIVGVPETKMIGTEDHRRKDAIDQEVEERRK